MKRGLKYHSLKTWGTFLVTEPVCSSNFVLLKEPRSLFLHVHMPAFHCLPCAFSKLRKITSCVYFKPQISVHWYPIIRTVNLPNIYHCLQNEAILDLAVSSLFSLGFTHSDRFLFLFLLIQVWTPFSNKSLVFFFLFTFVLHSKCH